MLKVVHHKVQQVLKDQQEDKEPKVRKVDKVRKDKDKATFVWS